MKHVGLILFGWLFASSGLAQDFQVVATTPAPGDSSVALRSTVTFTFSAPLDTTARFGEGDTLPVAFFTMSPPDSIRIDSTYFSDDLTRLSFDVTHTDSTDFIWMLTGAKDQAGRMLCQPHVLSYTTAPEQGRFSVQGAVFIYFLVKRVACAMFGTPVVALLDASPWDGTYQVRAAGLAPFDEEYYIPHVREGTYWPVVFVDPDEDGVFSPDWYGGGALVAEASYYSMDGFKPDSIVVSETTPSADRIDFVFAGPGATRYPDEIPGVAVLLPNYPNPFNPQTTLSFRLDQPARVRLVIYDVLGRHVATVAEGVYHAATHTVVWEAQALPGGLYLMRLEGPHFILARPLVLVK